LAIPERATNTISQTAADPRGANVTSRGPAAFGLVMRNGLLAVLVLVTAACGAYHVPGGSAGGTGTVTGSVTVIPCGPVQPAQPDFAPCKMRPSAGLEIDFTSDSGAVTSTKTGSDGRYTIELPAGPYKVTVKNYMRVISGPPNVSVKAGSTVVADYVLDSGIRTAVPQQ
jgi:type 1 fimbria pilin